MPGWSHKPSPSAPFDVPRGVLAPPKGTSSLRRAVQNLRITYSARSPALGLVSPPVRLVQLIVLVKIIISVNDTNTLRRPLGSGVVLLTPAVCCKECGAIYRIGLRIVKAAETNAKDRICRERKRAWYAMYFQRSQRIAMKRTPRARGRQRRKAPWLPLHMRCALNEALKA